MSTFQLRILSHQVPEHQKNIIRNKCNFKNSINDLLSIQRKTAHELLYTFNKHLQMTQLLGVTPAEDFTVKLGEAYLSRYNVTFNELSI